MGRAKEIIVKVIPAKIANEFVKKHHYSKNYVRNSCLHFGCFLDTKLHGVLSYGSPMSKQKVINLVANTNWNEMLELNRMCFDDYLPKYSESRCISITLKLIKKKSPQIKWILSFSDGTQCGDGTIYRASGFVLTAIKENTGIYKDAKGNIYAKGYGEAYRLAKGLVKREKEQKLSGFQLRYIYLIDKSCKITVPILPFSKIDEMGAGMYKGKKISLTERKAIVESVGVEPTKYPIITPHLSGEVESNANSNLES